jgi:hypothetical protein
MIFLGVTRARLVNPKGWPDPLIGVERSIGEMLGLRDPNGAWKNSTEELVRWLPEGSIRTEGGSRNAERWF